MVVLGAGSWGTALAILLARNGAEVHLAGRDLDEIDTMRLRRENARYLPGFALPAEVRVIPLADSPADADLAVIAVPAKAVREICAFVAPSATILVSSKGLEAGSGAILTEVVAEAVPGAEVGVISGPNLAVELVRGIPTVAVVAFPREETAERVRGAFMSRTYRVYIGSDIVGVELAGALKNVLAIGAGMIDGLGYGDNTKGAMLARGLHEMACLGVHMGARLETFFGIAGVGDLFATASVTEVHPLTVLEAMAAGLPVLGIRSPGIADTIEPEVNGLLSSEDQAAFAVKLARLLTDDELRARLAAGARATSEHYSIEATTQRHLELYEELLAARQPARLASQWGIARPRRGDWVRRHAEG